MIVSDWRRCWTLIALQHDAQMDFYGRRLATCASDRMIRIFDVLPTGQSHQLAELIGWVSTQLVFTQCFRHEGPVWQVCWSHPKFESLLASCSYDHKVIIWKEVSAQKWQKLHEHTVHGASVNSVAWAPYELGCALACGSTDKSISVLKYMRG